MSPTPRRLSPRARSAAISAVARRGRPSGAFEAATATAGGASWVGEARAGTAAGTGSAGTAAGAGAGTAAGTGSADAAGKAGAGRAASTVADILAAAAVLDKASAPALTAASLAGGSPRTVCCAAGCISKTPMLAAATIAPAARPTRTIGKASPVQARGSDDGRPERDNSFPG